MEPLVKPLSINAMKNFKGNITELKSFISEIISSDDYLKSVELAADLKDGFIIKNSGAYHATIVMSNIFRTAETYVCIFAGNLKGDVSNGEYLKELRKYLQKSNTMLDVILEKEPESITPAIKEILDARSRRPSDIRIGWLNDSAILTENQHHFTISDDRMYRMEIDVQNYIAIASFNDPTTVSELKEKFYKMKFQSLKIAD